MSKDAVSVVQDAYAAFGRGDIPAVLAMLTPDATWETVGRRQDYPMFGLRHGPEGAGEFFRLLVELENLTAFEPRTIQGAGELAVAQGRAAGTMRNNGKPFELEFVHLFTVRDGKVAAFREFYDTASLVEAYKG